MDTFVADDGVTRCGWCRATAQYRDYHDQEWGYPVSDDRQLFEKLCLESFQAGLSWRTILTKRDHFRRAFEGFDIATVAKFDTSDVNRLVLDAGIVRHRGKIEAVIHNATCALRLIEQEGSLASYLWQFEPKQRPAQAYLQATSPESNALSKALKKQGWKFVGPTTMYAFMQSVGMVNDHHDDCVFHAKAATARAVFTRPL